MSDLLRRQSVLSAVVALVAGLLFGLQVVSPDQSPTSASRASAQSCSDVQVIFARGRIESVGLGQVGNAFVNALRSKTSKSVSSYAVDYPADNEIDVGANDMSRQIQTMAANCPDTRLVVGGYSLGAGVTDVVLAVPFQFFGFDNPLPPGAEQHIAAVALFGNGIQWAGPIGNFNPIYSERTIDLCHGADPVCNPTSPRNWETNWPDHAADEYISSGMVNQAADFVAGRI